MIVLSMVFLVHLSANSDMAIIDYNDGGDVQAVEIKDKRGGVCRVAMDVVPSVVQTNCIRLTNSKGIKILCTGKKQICKREDEVFDFIKNYRPTSKPTNVTHNNSLKLRQGMPYSQAREIILDAGWQGKNISPRDLTGGETTEIFFDNGWRELQDCAGTGMAYCRFEFRNIANQTLVVITIGECVKTSKVKCEKYLESWSLGRPLHSRGFYSN